MKQKTKFKKTEIGMIPEDWEIDKLGNHINLIKGVSYRSKDYCSADEGIIFINLKCVARNGGFREEGIKYYKGEVKENQFVNSGDIIIANTDLTQNKEIIGSPLKIPDLNDGRKMCISLDLSKLDIISSKIYGDFLYYYLMSPIARHFMIANGNGTTVIHLATKNVPNMLIPVPSLSEQKKIVTILSDLDSKIELNQAMNKTLEAIGQAIFKRWFVDFEFPNEKGKPYKSSGGEMVDSELGKIPKGWKVSKVGDELDTVLGGTPSTTNKAYWENGTIAWLNSGKINEFRITEPTALITEDAVNKSATKIMPKGTTVLAITGATLGQVSRIEIDACANQSVIGIIESEFVSSEYIYYWIKNSINKMIRSQTGGAQQHINKNNVNTSEILLSSNKIMQNFSKIMRPIFHHIGISCFENKNISQIRDSLLPNLMSGKIRVPVEVRA